MPRDHHPICLNFTESDSPADLFALYALRLMRHCPELTRLDFSAPLGDCPCLRSKRGSNNKEGLFQPQLEAS